MEYGVLGNSGIQVSKICVGCMSFGQPSEDFHLWTLDESCTTSMVKKALDLGITFFDTANCYSHGTSEVYLGKALRTLGVARDRVVIASKVYFNDGHLSATAIAREIDGTLSRLGTDYLDLYIIHRFDKTTAPEETMEALHNLVVAGKVRALGASAMYGYQFAKLQRVAEQHGWTPFVSMQNHYNLLYREDERELIPICKESNVALTPYSPLAAGRLCRPEWKTDTARSKTDKTSEKKYDTTQEQDKVIAARVAELAAQKHCTMTQISLAWLFAKGITSALVGATKEPYFDDAAGTFRVSLSADDIAYLEAPYLPHKVMGALS